MRTSFCACVELTLLLVIQGPPCGNADQAGRPSQAKQPLATTRRVAALIEKVDILGTQEVRITLSDGRTTSYRAEDDVTGAVNGGRGTISEPVAIADDKSACGWFVKYDWPGVTYQVPQVIAVYRPGKPLKYVGASDTSYVVMVSWAFVRGGKQVAIYRNALHGPDEPIFELHDVETGRMLQKWAGELSDKSPRWADVFAEEH